MNNIVLVFPNISYKEDAINFINEIVSTDELIEGTSDLDKYINNYENWLIKINNERIKEELVTGRVLADTYFYVRKEDNRIVGLINIRHELNDYLLKYGGHIGYCVRPSDRKKGYATIGLSLGLKELKRINITKALITCNDSNIGSAKTIEKNGGILENKLFNKDTDTNVRRYWIQDSNKI